MEKSDAVLKKESFQEVIRKAIEELGIDKTLRSREWRIDNLYKIKDKEGNVVTFVRNRAQKHFDDNRHFRNLILKARQMGFSTLECIDNLDQALFNPNQSNLIIAHTVPDAKKQFSKMEFAWNNLPDFIKDMVYLKSKTASGFEIGFDKIQNIELSKQPGKIISTVGVDTSGRSGTFSRVHITELSYLDAKEPEKAEEVMSGTIPAIPANGRVDIESTARGNAGEFYNIYMGAAGKEPQSNKEFKAHFYNWQWDDVELNGITEAQIEFVISGKGDEWTKFKDYQEEHKLTDREIACYYYFWVSCARNWDRLRQEYPTTPEEAFSSGDDRVFSGTKLDEYEALSAHERGKWKYYKMPNPGHKYVVGSDPAEGVGRDNSTIVVMDITTLIPEIVAVFACDEISPTELAYEIATACRYYNSALASVERNNSGHAVIAQLVQVYDTFRIYKEIRKDKKRPQKTDRYGWLTSAQTKYKMVFDFKEAVEDFKIALNSAELIMELRMYTKDIVANEMGRTELKLGAGRAGGKHYDIAVAAFICYQTIGDAQMLPGIMPTDSKRKERLLRRQQMR